MGIVNRLKRIFTNDSSAYCHKCNACGIDGCCSALTCAYESMVINRKGDYCEGYYKDIEFAYEMYHALYDKYPDGEIFAEIYNKVYASPQQQLKDAGYGFKE